MPWPWNPGQRLLKVLGTDTDWSATYNFLLTLHSNHDPISYHFRDKQRFLPKIANFSHPHVFNAPADGSSPWNWVSAQGGQKTRMIGLPGGQKNFKISSFSRLDTIPACDRQTSGQPAIHLLTAKTALTHCIMRAKTLYIRYIFSCVLGLNNKQWQINNNELTNRCN